MKRWAVDEATIYAPGMQVYSALSDTEREELSLSYGDAREARLEHPMRHIKGIFRQAQR